MSDPFKELARALNEKSKQHAGRVMLALQAELGTITDTGLKLDRFKHEIRDYLVADYLTLDTDFFTTTELNSGAHYQYEGDGTHDHQIVTPESLKPLAPGDRVLVLPVNGGQDFVVVARVVSAGA